MKTSTRVEFLRKHVTDKQGHSWSADGREWVVDEIFRPLDGWKAWPRSRERLCDDCAGHIGDIVDASDALDSTVDHAPECAGLDAIKIVVLLLPLERRAGKSFNVCAFIIAELFKRKRWRGSMVASSEPQILDIVEQNIVGPIERAPALRGRANVLADRVEVSSTGSRLRWLSHSVSAVTGKGESFLFFDESRSIDAKIAAMLIPSAYEEHGWECQKCGFRPKLKPIEKPQGRACPQECGGRLEEYSGLIVFASNQGMLTGDDESDWFAAMVSHLEANPDPRFHVFNPDEGTQLNPAIQAAGVKSAIVDVISNVPGIGPHITAESRNRFQSEGEDVLGPGVVEACMDRSLQYASQSSAPSIAFLDTSISVDATNLVVLAQDIERNTGARNPWGWLRLERADIWDPAKQPGGQINESIICPVVSELMLRFPGVIKLLVDVRGGKPKWVQEFIVWSKSQPWSKKIEEFNARADRERDAGWIAIHEHYTARTISMPWDPRILKEMQGVKWHVRPDGTRTVVDKKRRKHAGSQAGRHRELTESIAIARWKDRKSVV